MATLGTAAHEIYAQMVVQDENYHPGDDIARLAVEHDVDEDELAMLAWCGIREWKKIADRLDVQLVEGQLETIVGGRARLRGSPDVVATLKDDPTTTVVLDWKTGYREANPIDQIMGYAYLADTLGVSGREASKYVLMSVWTRLGVVETAEYSQSQVSGFGKRVAAAFRSLDESPRYSPSERNCMYCPLALECDARRALLATAGRDMLAVAQDEQRELAPADLAALYPQSRMLKKALDAYEKQLRAAVKAAGGRIAFDGGEIELKESTRKTITWNPEIVAEYVAEEHRDELRPTISKTALEKAVAASAPRGQKGTAKEAVLDALREAGCVDEKTTKSLAYRATA